MANLVRSLGFYQKEITGVIFERKTTGVVFGTWSRG